MSISRQPNENSSSRAKTDRFADLARELECDEDETRFEETVKKVAKAPPSKDDEA